MATRGVVLLAHGARDPAWAEPFEAIRRRLEAHGEDAAVQDAMAKAALTAELKT